MFTVPEMPSAGFAGVGTLVTSMRDMLSASYTQLTLPRTAYLPVAVASEEPSIVTEVMLGSKPRTATAFGESAQTRSC